MKTVTISKALLSPITLPGMGRSVDVAGLSAEEVSEIRSTFAQGELQISFEEEPNTCHPVINMWVNPHASQVTLFIK